MTDGERVFVIAEAGSNWRMGTPARDRLMGFELIDVAIEAGADAVKFQTFRAQDVYVADAGPSKYLADGGIDESINEIFEDLEMPYELVADLADHCVAAGIEFMTTPFSVADAAAIEPHVRRHKVASYEINHVRLLQFLAGTGKPLIMSTGAATVSDIEYGLATVRAAGATDITLLQCTARYPAPPESLNVSVIPWLRDRFGVPSGLSDHSRDPVIGPVSAVALGATVIEKHFTVDHRLPGPDHRFALDPAELALMVRCIRMAQAARGDGIKQPHEEEAELRGFAVRTVQATRDLAPGTVLVEDDDYAVLRPGRRTRGMHPRYVEALAGRQVKRAIAAGDGILETDVDPPL